MKIKSVKKGKWCKSKVQDKEEKSTLGQLWMSCCLSPSINPDFWGSEDHLETSLLAPGIKRRAEFSWVIAGSPQDSGWPSSFHSQTCTYPRNWTTTVASGGTYIHDVCVGTLTVVPLEYTMTVTWESADWFVIRSVFVRNWLEWVEDTILQISRFLLRLSVQSGAETQTFIRFRKQATCHKTRLTEAPLPGTEQRCQMA